MLYVLLFILKSFNPFSVFIFVLNQKNIQILTQKQNKNNLMETSFFFYLKPVKNSE